MSSWEDDTSVDIVVANNIHPGSYSLLQLEQHVVYGPNSMVDVALSRMFGLTELVARVQGMKGSLLYSIRRSKRKVLSGCLQNCLPRTEYTPVTAWRVNQVYIY